MSKLSRISLTPLLALTLSTACDTDQDDQVEDQLTEDDDDVFRTTRSGRYGGGKVLNTNNLGGHFFDHIALTGMASGLELIDVETAGFDYSGSRPGWEHDDVGAHHFIDSPGGTFDLVVDGDHLLTGHTTGGMLLRHGDFHNSKWTFQAEPGLIPLLDAENVNHDGAGRIEMRLEVSWIHPDNILPVPPGLGEDSDEAWVAQQGSIPIYTFYYTQDFEEVSTCDSSPGQKYTEAVLYNNVEVDQVYGDVTYTDDVLYVGCLQGAVGKAGGLWGYWPDRVDNESVMVSGDDRENFDTATRVVRADYCADGTDYFTTVGNELDVYDVLTGTVHTNHAVDPYHDRPGVEAVWAPGGAVCVENPRLVPSWAIHCSPPPCGNKTASFNTLNAPGVETMLTRTFDAMEPNIP